MQKRSGNKGIPLSVSQNFLTQSHTIWGLLHQSSITNRDHVLEIGAGKGHLTRALIQRAHRVTAYELDAILFQKLSQKFADTPNLTLFQGDFLSMPLPQKEPYKVFSNIPFSITTPIVNKITTAPNPPIDTYLLVEWGAAKRFCGQPVENHASLLLKPYFHCSILSRVPRTAFHPMPKVDAALLHLEKKQTSDLPPAQRQAFSRFIQHHQRTGFSRGAWLTKKQVSTALRLASLPPLEQSATLSYVQWLCLFRCCRQMGRGH
ncbi:23S ribosomal RNA methyltransferase Erm [Eubacteriales bacterium OttesenSCG-928-M02]|nr:23S ribosomal RNA methyltransferase Erm [Eubacteriales bacterium OttesenSCG-928-M02]